MINNTIILKNGADEFKPAVVVIMMSLENLFKDAPLVFYDLVMLCRDRDYKVFNLDKAVALNLVSETKKVHDTIRNVVLSAVTGDKFDMILGSPT